MVEFQLEVADLALRKDLESQLDQAKQKELKVDLKLIAHLR